MNDDKSGIESEVKAALVSNASKPVTIEARFEAVRPGFVDPPRASELVNWQCFEGMVLVLVFTDGEKHVVMGSAVMVAPCVAICASHTITELLPKVKDGSLTLAAMGVTSHGANIWTVRSILTVQRTDLSVVTLKLESQPPETPTFYQATITTRLPAIGETVVFAGFRASNDEFLTTADRTLEIAGTLRIGSGPVTQSFPLGRDSLLVPWPSLEVNAPLFGGMSGGPVFDAHGGLIGLGSRSMEMGIGQEPSPMILALLWPALGNQFPHPQDSSALTTLHGLHGTLVAIDRPEAVTFERTPEGVVTNYTPWT